VFSSADTMPMKRPKRSLASNVSAVASAAPSSIRKLSVYFLPRVARCSGTFRDIAAGLPLSNLAAPQGVRQAVEWRRACATPGSPPNSNRLPPFCRITRVDRGPLIA
jgi:hypothetical protein